MDIAALPKVELHVHLDGILSPQMARTIQEQHPDFLIDPDEFEKAYPVHNLASFFNWYKYGTPLDANLEQYFWILEAYIAQLKTQNVKYLEVLIATGEISPDPVEALEKMQTFREKVNICEAGEIQIEFIACLNRALSLENFAARVARIMPLVDAGLIVGVSLAGAEIGNPASKFKDFFAHFHEISLPIEIHAGEWVGVESIQDALDYCYPTRIGHGVTLFDDPQLVEVFQERQIHIEMCPTSNLLTGSIQNFADHPIKKARDLGLNFSINTDDPGTFSCSMQSEYEAVTQHFGFTESDWQQVYQNSLQARFQKTLRAPHI